MLKLIISAGSVKRVPVLEANVPAKHVGILFVDGELKNTLSPGQYGFWQLNNKVEVKAFDLRSTIHEVSGQEILTKDKVSVPLLSYSMLLSRPSKLMM
jgi:regulator of protease activity HflC (stomatin/prohibitin superfamily)